MYNRYIPQSDGTHRRRPTPEPPQSAAPPPPEPRRHEPESIRPVQESSAPRQFPSGIGSFLRQILPKDFDAGDLIVVLLLLLMAADRQEEQNNALLTLALYLFL